MVDSYEFSSSCLCASEEESEESSSGEVEIEQEVASDPEDPRELHPGALLHRSSRLHNLHLMAEALAHGADVHAAAEEEEGKTPLIQAVIGVSVQNEGRKHGVQWYGMALLPHETNTGLSINYSTAQTLSQKY